MTTFEELKFRITHQVVAACCVGVSCYLWFFELCATTTHGVGNLCFFELSSAFAITIKVVLFFTVLPIVPVICFHGWGFFCCSLTQKERHSLALPVKAIPVWLLLSLISSHFLSNFLYEWLLGYSVSCPPGLVIQYFPLVTDFLWFKLKCFLFAAGSFFLLLLHRRAGRRKEISLIVAVLLGAFFATGTFQLMLSFSIFTFFEFWNFCSYVATNLSS